MVDIFNMAHDWVEIEVDGKCYQMALYNDCFQSSVKYASELELIKKLSLQEIKLVYNLQQVKQRNYRTPETELNKDLHHMYLTRPNSLSDIRELIAWWKTLVTQAKDRYGNALNEEEKTFFQMIIDVAEALYEMSVNYQYNDEASWALYREKALQQLLKLYKQSIDRIDKVKPNT
jgi:hypothetical protein